MKIANKPPKQITSTVMTKLSRDIAELKKEFDKIILVHKVAKTYKKKPRI